MSRRSRKGPAAIRQRMARRRKMRLLAIPLALLVAAGVAAYVVTREDPRPPVGTNVAEGLSDGPQRVLFADFGEGERKLREHLLVEDRARDVLELPRLGEVQAAPGSFYLSIQWWDEDVGAPRITVFDPRTGDRQDVPGFAHEPVWHPTGELLAYSEPVDPDRCTQDDCAGDDRIHIFDPATGSSEVAVEAGPWFLRFWVGDRILYQDEDDTTIVHIQGLEGGRTTIDVWARAAHGASPDGRWLFVSWEEETAFYPLAPDGSFAGDPVQVDLPARRGLRFAAWSHDSSALVGASGGVSRSELFLLSPDDPEPRRLAEVEGMVTRVAWAPDNSEVLVTMVSDKFETMICPVIGAAEDAGCRPLFDWTTGIAPLRMEGSAA